MHSHNLGACLGVCGFMFENYIPVAHFVNALFLISQARPRKAVRRIVEAKPPNIEYCGNWSCLPVPAFQDEQLGFLFVALHFRTQRRSANITKELCFAFAPVP